MDTERILQRQKAYESFQILLKEGKMNSTYIHHDGHLKLANFHEDEKETFYAEVNFWDYQDQTNPVIPHRLDGPAINAEGREEYWIHGKQYFSQEEFEAAKKN